MVTSEDDPNMAMSYRLRAANADLSKVYDMTDDFVVPDAIPALRETIDSIGDVRMVVIDPLSAVSSIPLTSSNVRVRRQVMNPLERLAKDLGVAMPVVHHTVKSGRVAGTKGITDSARMVLRVSRLASDERVRVIHVEKSNIASDAASDVGYTVTGSFPNVAVEYLAMPEGDEARGHIPSTAERVTEHLRSAAQPLAPQDIARDLHVPYGTVRVALTRLKRDGIVMSPARGLWVLAPSMMEGR